MRLNKDFEVAIAVVAYLRRSKNKDPIPAVVLADASKSSTGFVLKVCYKLSASGLIVACGGRYGGYKSVKNSVSIMDIFKSLDYVLETSMDSTVQQFHKKIKHLMEEFTI